MQTIVHDAAFQWGGAERVVQELSNAAPVAPNVRFIAADADVIRAQRLRAGRVDVQFPRLASGRAFRAATPLMAVKLPRAVPVEGHVTYSSYAVARWLPSREPRFVYNHAPMRQIWHGAAMYKRGLGPEALALRAAGPWLRAVDRRATMTNDYVVAPSHRIARVLESTLGVRVRDVIPPPVNDDLFSHPLVSNDSNYFVWVGRVVDPVKKISLLLELFAASPNHELLIVGDGRDRQRLEAAAPANVRFVGWQSGETKASLISHARALILPSLEDFGLSAAEALALGVPTLVTPDAGVAEWAKECSAIHVVNGDLDTMARGLETIRAVERGASVRGYAERFSSRTFRSRVRECWRDLGWLT